MKTDWDGLQEELGALPDEEKDAIKDHFNQLIDDKDNIGEVLFAEKEDFFVVMSQMSEE